MLSAVSRAAVVLGDQQYADRADAAAQFISTHLAMPDSDKLYRSAYRGDGDTVTL